MSSAVVGLGCLACLSFLLGCSRRRSVGASGAGTAAVVVAGCPALVVPGPLSQQMSCQRSRVGRRACGPPVWSQMNRSRRQRRDQRKQQSGGSPGAVVGSARGGRGTTTEPSRGPAAWATTAGECGAGCGGAATAAGGGCRRSIAAGPDGYPGRGAAARRRQDCYQRSAFSAGCHRGLLSSQLVRLRRSSPATARNRPGHEHPRQRRPRAITGKSTGTCCSGRRSDHPPLGGAGWCIW